MQFELRPAVYEFLALLQVTLYSPESRTTRACGLIVALMMPLFAILAMLANRPDVANQQLPHGPHTPHILGEWEKGWAVERYPATGRPSGRSAPD